MTVTVQYAPTVFLGDDITTTFPITWSYSTQAPIVLYLRQAGSADQLLSEDVDYSVSGQTITYPLIGAPLATGTSLVATRQSTLTQPVDLNEQGGFFLSAINNFFDNIIRAMQERAEVASRSFRVAAGFSVGEVSVGPENTTLKFDANGNLIEGPSVADLSNAEANATAAQASADAAADSAAQALIELGPLADTTVVYEAVTGDVQIDYDRTATYAAQVALANSSFTKMAALRTWFRLNVVGDLHEWLTYLPERRAVDGYQTDEYLSDERLLGLPQDKIFRIPGNHDGDDQSSTGSLYGKSMRPYEHAYGATTYKVIDGNILKVMIGDEAYSTAGVVSQRTLDWIDDVCTHADGKSIEWYIHQPLQDTTEDTLVTDTDNIQTNSAALMALAEKHLVCAIFHGHVAVDLADAGVTSHMVHSFSYTDGEGASQTGNIFICNCGLHIPTALDSPGFDVTFVELARTVGSKTVTVRRYNLVTDAYVAAKETTYQLLHNWYGEGQVYHDGRLYTDINLITTAPVFLSNLKRQDLGGGVFGVPADHTHEALTYGATELNNDDVNSGLFIAQVGVMAGALSSDLINNYEKVLRSGPRRLTGTEANYSSEYVIQLGYDDGGTWAFSDVLTVQPETGEIAGLGGKLLIDPSRRQIIDDVFVETSNITTVSNNTYTDVSGLTITHTAADATHKVRLEVSIRVGGEAAAYSFFQVVRDGVAIGNGAANGAQTVSRSGVVSHDSVFAMRDVHFVVELDAVDTAPHTYKVQMASWSTNDSHVNRTHDDSDNDYSSRGISTMCLKELTA